ncbi:hypothetical protein RHSIM_Rhsim06G0083000 [Rhododendron simsii]|uniref:Retrovirus-related Pol polyprotein from transposon TNT 1-94-like beta-barrel domain-containing protein n=1 Tax=Rhododendron simsii TaxID=118357 RepID=A0A834LL03_RHOSS|nr:hypothetical protein RHSIM_Rhsim06G0083000 [Rhododendron simsii]
MATSLAPPLMAPPAKNKQPPSTMMFLRPKAAVRRLATRDEAKPAMYRDDVNAVKVLLLYMQYMFVLASAAFFSIDGKNFLRNGTIVVTPPVTINLMHLQSALVSHFTQKKSSSKGGENSALAVQSENRRKTSDGRSGGNNRSWSSSRGKGVQCYSCKEFGHVKRDYPLRKYKGKKFDDASSANSLVLADDGDLLIVSEGINTSSRDEWILDSGCTMHVCSKKEFFDTFQEKDSGSLFLSDGTPCGIQGFGKVKIKMFDGAVCTLGGVAYVLKLRRNLISLSRMDFIGCKCFAGGGAMKITRGGKVLMKGEKCKGLYRLIGKKLFTQQRFGNGMHKEMGTKV